MNRVAYSSRFNLVNNLVYYLRDGKNVFFLPELISILSLLLDEVHIARSITKSLTKYTYTQNGIFLCLVF